LDKAHRHTFYLTCRRSARQCDLFTYVPGIVALIWSLDFLRDQLSDGRRFRILAVVGDFTRECLALVADTSLSGRRVGRELDAVVAEVATNTF